MPSEYSVFDFTSVAVTILRHVTLVYDKQKGWVILVLHINSILDVVAAICFVLMEQFVAHWARVQTDPALNTLSVRFITDINFIDCPYLY